MQDIYVGDVCKGFPLVLVHGFLGSSEMWKPQIKFLKKNYRVLTLDLPGFGKSNKVRSHDSINYMANTVLKTLKEKNIKNITLIIWGDKDRANDFKQVETLKNNIPNSDIVIFKGCSHNAHLEMPDKFNETLKTFLES